MTRPNPWPQERLDRLRTLHAAGWNSQQIADELGATRNAVLAKARFMGLRFLRPHQRSGEAGGTIVATGLATAAGNDPLLRPPVRAKKPTPAMARARAREKEVQRFHAAGMTAAAIAERLGTSRGAVGRVLMRLRLGTASRGAPCGKDAGGLPAAAPEPVEAKLAQGDRRLRPAEVEAFEKVGANTGAGLLDLTRSSCRWIVGKTGPGDYRYCGRPVEIDADALGRQAIGVIGTRYCAEHAERMRARPRGGAAQASLARVAKV